MRRRQYQTLKGRLNLVQESCRMKLVRIQKLPLGKQRGAPYRALAAEKPESSLGMKQRLSMTK